MCQHCAMRTYCVLSRHSSDRCSTELRLPLRCWGSRSYKMCLVADFFTYCTAGRERESSARIVTEIKEKTYAHIFFFLVIAVTTLCCLTMSRLVRGRAGVDFTLLGDSTEAEEAASGADVTPLRYLCQHGAMTDNSGICHCCVESANFYYECDNI